MTHGYELRWWNAGESDGAGWRGIKGRKKWDNCNSIINKIYFKNKEKSHSFFLVFVHEMWTPLTLSPITILQFEMVNFMCQLY